MNESLPNIFIVGLGISGFAQVTREVEQALALCKSVFYVHTEPYIESYLKRFCSDVHDLRTLYSEDQPRLATYHTMANAVLKAAESTRPVGFALYGHPLYFVSPSQMIVEECRKRGWHAEVMPGISALDTLCVDLSFDPATRGLVQYEANYCLVYRPRLDPAVPCLIWQPGSVETRGYHPQPSKPERFLRLQKYLLQFYSPTHLVAFATSASNPLVDAEIIWSELGQFHLRAKDITGICTMFIPAERQPVVQDHEALRALDDPDHIARLVDGGDSSPPPAQGS